MKTIKGDSKRNQRRLRMQERETAFARTLSHVRENLISFSREPYLVFARTLSRVRENLISFSREPYLAKSRTLSRGIENLISRNQYFHLGWNR
jgi:ribosomal protein L18